LLAKASALQYHRELTHRFREQVRSHDDMRTFSLTNASVKC